MIYKYKNFRLELPTGTKDGDIFIGCNLIQIIPHTTICSGIVDLTFTRCNLTNCNVPKDAKVIDCGGYGRHKSRCSHLHPEMIERGLSLCEENCSHVIGADEIWVDSILIDTIYYYQDKRVE